MKRFFSLELGVRAAALTAGSAILAACGGSSTNATLTGVSAVPQLWQQHPVAPAVRRYAKSWIKPDAVPKKLLYVSDYLGGDVLIYTYPEMTFAGELTGFVEPVGECTDRAGDVWIADYKGFAVYEYAHGGTTPIQVLNNDLDGPTGCAIDPKSGALAVTNSADWVAIFPNATGTAATYQLPPFTIPFFDSYDNKGNLFVDGDSTSQTFLLYELPAGGSTFNSIVLNQQPSNSGDIQWDGKYIVIGDLFGTLYQTQGSNVVGTIPLAQNYGLEGFFIPPQHKKVLAVTTGGVNVYRYPAATFVKEVTGGQQQAFDVVISP